MSAYINQGAKYTKEVVYEDCAEVVIPLGTEVYDLYKTLGRNIANGARLLGSSTDRNGTVRLIFFYDGQSTDD